MNFSYLMPLKPAYILSIDPAAYGTTGVVIYDFKNFQLVGNFNFFATNFQEAIKIFKETLSKFQQSFQKETKTIFKPKYVILENYELWTLQKLTKPLETAKVVGSFLVLLEDYFFWKPVILQRPRCKLLWSKIVDLKNADEIDAFRHIQYFLQHYFKKI